MVGLQSLRQIPLRLLHVADPVIRHGQIALPARVAGFCVCQPFANGKVVAVGLQCLRQMALRHTDIAYSQPSPIDFLLLPLGFGQLQHPS